MSWYDQFARVYDQSVERVYAAYRGRIVDAARLKPGGAVLDLPTGTGPNLPGMTQAVGPSGRVLACDLSQGMLSRARSRPLPGGGPPVDFLCADARMLTPQTLAELGIPALDAVVVALGLTVFPDWEVVFERTWDLLRPGGRYVVFDIHQDRWVPQSAMVRLLAGADMTRRVWAPLEAEGEAFSLTWLEGSRHVHGGMPFLATAVRPAAS